MFFYTEKKYTNFARIDNYVALHENYHEWCTKCVYFGDTTKSTYWLCAKHYPEVSIVSYCGHCDRFSDTEKINPLKRWLLKRKGFQFRNKVR